MDKDEIMRLLQSGDVDAIREHTADLNEYLLDELQEMADVWSGDNANDKMVRLLIGVMTQMVMGIEAAPLKETSGPIKMLATQAYFQQAAVVDKLKVLTGIRRGE